ncbi:uncharacterized protein LOC122073854 isoform X2 [Macadamia integrifolia]|nr:uncharacterized protein LOC122073854 isoform X2 [Macadamia integrifolia]XP_042494457.1 uncharacterized protein LOC122073854 isoform X2 [Macadamia integrifolia]
MLLYFVRSIIKNEKLLPEFATLPSTKQKLTWLDHGDEWTKESGGMVHDTWHVVPFTFLCVLGSCYCFQNSGPTRHREGGGVGTLTIQSSPYIARSNQMARHEHKNPLRKAGSGSENSKIGVYVGLSQQLDLHYHPSLTDNKGEVI